MSATASLKALLAGVIDYAGLFPPANLDLETALANYSRIQDREERWMLARFILPAARLDEAADLKTVVHPASGLPLSVIGRGGDSWQRFFSALERDIQDVATFRQRAGQATIEMIEVRLPGDDLDFQIRSDALVSRATELANAAGLFPFFEVPFNERWQPRAARLFASLAAAGGAAGFKLRTGGVSPEAFPSCRQIAWALTTAASAGTRLKCTAGLHHPIRRFDASVDAKMHGFLNVFGGAALAAANGLSVDALAAILADEDPQNFIFSDAGLRWEDVTASTEAIEGLRRSIFVGFGSCSFDEPLEDLMILGLI